MEVDGKPAKVHTAHIDLAITRVDIFPWQHDLKGEHPVMGSALVVPLSTPVKVGATVNVLVNYATTQKSKALQWLDKEYIMRCPTYQVDLCG